MPNTREKLIELCEDVILSCKSSLCDDCEHNCIDYPNCMGVHFADHLIANGVTVQKWIPVTERLPEYGKVVLAFGKKHATSGQFRGTSPTKPNWWHWKGNMYKEVSHWMPLPEPPKDQQHKHFPNGDCT